MRGSCKISIVLLLVLINGVFGDNPYRFFTWKITYGDIYPLGVKQQVCSFNCFFFFFFSLSWFFTFSLFVFSRNLVITFSRVGFCVMQGILINGQFPGPHIDAITNDNIIISVFNYLKEPFLISW